MARGNYPRTGYKKTTAEAIKKAMEAYSKMPKEALATTDEDASVSGTVSLEMPGSRSLSKTMAARCRRAVLLGLEVKEYTIEELEKALAPFPVKTQTILLKMRTGGELKAGKLAMPETDADKLALASSAGGTKILANIRNRENLPDVRIAPAQMQSSMYTMAEGYIPMLETYHVTRFVMEKAPDSGIWFMKTLRTVEDTVPLTRAACRQ